MATLFELKKEILEGRSIKRKGWKNYCVPSDFFVGSTIDMFADDWELVPLPKEKKKVTVYQYLYKPADGFFMRLSDCIYTSEEEFYSYHNKDDYKILKTVAHELEIEE